MANPSTATYSFLSWARQGLAARAGLAGGLAVKDGHLALPVRLKLNNQNLGDIPAQLYGPGDVIGIDAREIVRTEPQNLMASFEPNYFPFIEFNHPDFPWMFTPALADASGKLQPWLCLVVARKDNATLSLDPNRPLPLLDCAIQELPNLGELNFWAHTQVTQGAAISNLADALASQSQSVSRLLCPRRLEQHTAYYACVVPSFEVGCKAGRGESISPDDEKALRPSWSSDPANAQNRIQLPVYYHWEFSTGLEGDFEALARRLQAQDLPDTVGVNEVSVSNPGWGVGPFPAGTAGSVVEVEGALRNPDHPANAWADPVRGQFQTSLRTILDTSPKPQSSATAATVTPPLYGQWYPMLDGVPPQGAPPQWFSEVNIEVRNRVAAGLGAQVVRFRHEDRMASAWDQLAKHDADNDQLKRIQLAEEVGHTMMDKHLAPLSPQRFMQVTAPLHSAVSRLTEAKAPVAAARATGGMTPVPSGNPSSSAAFRRIARARGPVARRQASSTAAKSVAGATVTQQAFKGMVMAQINPRATALAAAQEQTPTAQSTDLVRFAPSFPQPMYEALRDYFADMLLPGLENVPSNSITVLETNPQFVEAFMLGLNHEMSRELLWRGHPTDRRGTYFRQFWDASGQVLPPGTQQPDLADIKPISEWAVTSHLGDHALRNTASSQMVLVIRGDLLNRYPRAMIYAVSAVWSSTAENAQRQLGTKELYPTFRVTKAPDITMLGFVLTEADARGADKPSTPPNDNAGWFFVLQEQPTEPRFGLQVATGQSFGAKPAQWTDLSWGNLAPNAAALQQILNVSANGPLNGLTLGPATWGKNSAHMAWIFRQNPFRLAVHARTWLRAKPTAPAGAQGAKK